MERTPTGYRYDKVEVDIKNRLSPRSAQALTLAATGMPRKQIAKELGLKQSSISSLFDALYFQLGARNIIDAIYIAVTQGYMRYLCAICLVLFSYMQTDQPIRNQTARVRIGSRHVRNNRTRRRENLNNTIA
ncbi:LuxR C-terminal-related transcriptional regulator [Catenovulum sediminis]|uniref:LuxR C-terminal-related transcriptional regulator n=1 Tax=Catenovulum sediminis TaxID=1740262 RepID=UPI00117F5B01|nr:LuxR C-terminal-related transcriptional regulator [Catenovulum sediminis]